MADNHFAYEDFESGQVIELGSKVVTAEEIVEFASEFDPQPMHLDEDAGKASLLGGLSASGWHSCAMYMRMFYDGILKGSTSQGAPGIDYTNWRRPVLAGDTLAARVTISGKRLSRSRPGLGLVTFRAEMSNQRGEVVFDLQNTSMFLTREATHDAR